MAVWDPVLKRREITPNAGKTPPQGDFRKSPSLTRESRRNYSRAEKMRRYYEYLDQWRGFIKTIHQIQLNLEKHLEDPSTDSKTVTCQDLENQVHPLLSKLPNRYQFLVRHTIAEFIKNRDASLSVLSDNGVKNQFIQKVKEVHGLEVLPEDIVFGDFCLELKVTQENLNKSANVLQGLNVGGTAANKKLGDNLPTFFLILPKNPSENGVPPEDAKAHEKEHIKQFFQLIFNVSQNLSMTLSKESNITGSPLDLTPDIPKEYYFILTGYSKEFDSQLSNNNTRLESEKILNTLRSKFFLQVRWEILAHLTEKNFLSINRTVLGTRSLTPQVYLEEIFKIRGLYDYATEYKDIFLKHFSSDKDRNLWKTMIEDEYQKIIKSALDGFFSVVSLDDNGRDRENRSGISIEEACDFFGMYSLEDWGKVAIRYNTRSYTGTRIVGNEKFYGNIKSSMELLRKIPWYYSIQKYLHEVKFDYPTGKSYISYIYRIPSTSPDKSPTNDKQTTREIKEEIPNPQHQDLVINAYHLFLAAYKLFCQEQGKQFQETEKLQDNVFRYIGSKEDLQRYRRSLIYSI